MPLRSFEGRVAVVTGAASGIGRAIAVELLRRGCEVALVDRDEAVHRVAQDLAPAGRRVSAHVCDVGDRAAMTRLPDAVLAQHAGVHVLVNNAGVSVAGRFEDVGLDDLEWAVQVNFFGVVYGCKAFLPLLRRQEEGHILNVSSSFGLLGFAGKTAYCASKFAVRGFSEGLRAELLGSGLGVTVLYPGPVDTNILRRGRSVDAAQRDAEADFLASRAVPVERVAQRAVDGIRRNAARVMLSIDYRAIDVLTRLSPAAAQAITARLARRMPF